MVAPNQHFVIGVRLLVFLERGKKCQELTSKAVDIHSGISQPSVTTTGKDGMDTDDWEGKATSRQSPHPFFILNQKPESGEFEGRYFRRHKNWGTEEGR